MPVSSNARKGARLQDCFKIEKVSWQTHAQQLTFIRKAVFIDEQNVPVELEWDGLDETADHLLAYHTLGEAIGCARLLGDGRVGRMAVLKDWRNLNAGTTLLQAAIEEYRAQGQMLVKLSAQIHAIGFYEKFGFKLCSETYLDAGIVHRDMQRIHV